MRFLLAPAFLVVASGWAQVAPPPGSAAQQTPAIPQEEPATPEPQPQQPEEYGGPAILSRGGTATVAKGTELLRLRPYVSLDGVYDSNLGTIAVDQRGQVPVAGAYGADLRLGVTGSRTWKKTALDLDYRGALRHYSNRSYYDGMENSLTLSLRHQASRRVVLELGENAARYQRSYFLPASMGTMYDPMMASLTGNDLFDTPTYVLMSMGRIVYQRTARLSLSASGTGFFVRRRSAALAGATGYAATGDLAYRLGRYQTIGVDYTFSHFDFTHQFGSADIHGVSVSYAVRLNRRWELALAVGGYRVETLGLVRVALDPAIAAIFGQNYGIETYHRFIYAPRYDGHLTRGFQRGSWSLGYSRTVVPGNGVYLTSMQDIAQTSYNYSGFRRVSLEGHVNYGTYSSLAQTIGKYRAYGAGAGTSVKLSKVMSAVARIDGRHYDAGGSLLKRTSYQVTLGIAWSPGDYPLAIW